MKILYICSDNRSGSTLLDNLLAANSDVVSVGEIIHLDAYLAADRALYNPDQPLVCSCGAPVLECPFWTAVSFKAGRPLTSFRIDPQDALLGGRGPAWFKKRVQRGLRSHFFGLNRFKAVRSMTGGCRDASESFELFEAIALATGKRCIVDNSKDPLRALNLWFERPDAIKVILLTRDYRAVVHSKMKRNAPFERAVNSWGLRLREMEALSRMLPPETTTRLKYEDLCQDTESVMRKLCQFVDISFSPAMLSRSITAQHHLGGSPSKFDTERSSVTLDTSYRTAFSDEQLAHMRSLVGREAGRWGYRE